MPHINKPDRSLWTTICQRVTIYWMELSWCYHLYTRQVCKIYSIKFEGKIKKENVYDTFLYYYFFAGAQSYSKQRQGTLVQKKYKYIPVRSSMFGGLTSTMLKLWLLISKFQRFIRKSSAEINVSPSLQENKKVSWSKEQQFVSQYNKKIQHNWDKNLLFEMEFIW